MDDRFNTTAGWLLFAGIVGLGLSIVSTHYYEADRPELPEEGGYLVKAAEVGAAKEAGPSLATLLATGDAATGEKIFAKCMACHTITQGGPNGIGPNLWHVVGDEIAKGRGGFAFSSALSGHGGEWTYDNLNAWLTSPRAFASGTKMSFAGLSSPKDRADVILYLRENGGGPALPAPEPTAAASDASPAGAAPTGAAPTDGASAAAPAK